MAWLYVISAAVVDVGMFTLIKLFGFFRSWHSVIIAVLALAVPFIMQYALRGLPMGTAYAGFVGLATVGAVLVGIVFFQESLSWPRLFFVGLIVAGVIGLKLIENPAG